MLIDAESCSLARRTWDMISTLDWELRKNPWTFTHTCSSTAWCSSGEVYSPRLWEWEGVISIVVWSRKKSWSLKRFSAWMLVWKVPPTLPAPISPFEFLWCKPLGGGEALDRELGDWDESTHHPPPTAASAPLLELPGRPLLPGVINLFTCVPFDLLVVWKSSIVVPVGPLIVHVEHFKEVGVTGRGPYLLDTLWPFLSALSACAW